MRINVAQLLKEPIGATRGYDINQTADSPVQGELKLLRTDRGILVNGTLNTNVKTTCSRCLEEFEYPVTLDIEEEYFPKIELASGTNLPIPEETSAFTINENHEIDLSEAVRQYVLLIIPIKPLCREDCAGLCPHCGTNLNQGSCKCSPKSLNPQWAELKSMISKGEMPEEYREGVI